MKQPSLNLSLTRIAPVASINQVMSQYNYDLKKCEVSLNIGIFFDGTNNNMARDRPRLGHTNIARLLGTYQNDEKKGYVPIYIPGAGTRFAEIGEGEDSDFNAGCAFGCEGRVIFALLAVFNTLHSHCLRKSLFDSDTIRALCRNGFNVFTQKDYDNLAKLGIYHGLLQTNTNSDSNRRNFLKQHASSLEAVLEDAKPRVIECFLDVFGFSRGAAEARVFCHWLNELLVDGRLAGVALHFRFVGIMDTVASAGFWSSTASMLTNSTGGHGAWASAEALTVPTSVRNCVHMIAMHELRRNFPSDEIDKLQPGWVQCAYPGAHSDVGGGYCPGDLGIANGDDSSKLSQIPLNHMLDCAIKAGAPMKKPAATPGKFDPFAIHPDVAKAYDDFVSEATMAPRPMHEWLQQYLTWRWQIRDRFHLTNQVKRANKADREILVSFNNRLIADAGAMTRTATSLAQKAVAFFQSPLFAGTRMQLDLATTSMLEPEARDVLARAQRAKPTPSSFATLFENYVHDSLAGFNHPNLELTGYWRYRRAFRGSDTHTIAANQDAHTARSIA